MLKLNYLVPSMSEPIQVKDSNAQSNLWVDWVHHMVHENPDTIFFYTTDTTDVFDEETEESELTEIIARALRKCRVDDGAPVRLIREADIFHISHMVASEINAYKENK